MNYRPPQEPSPAAISDPAAFAYLDIIGYVMTGVIFFYYLQISELGQGVIIVGYMPSSAPTAVALEHTGSGERIPRIGR